MANIICDTKAFTIAVAIDEIEMVFYHIWRTPPPILEGGSDWIGVDVKNDTNNFEIEYKLRLLDESNQEIDDWPELTWRNLAPGVGERVGTEESHAAMACLHMKNMAPNEVTVKVELCVRKKGLL